MYGNDPSHLRTALCRNTIYGSETSNFFVWSPSCYHNAAANHIIFCVHIGYVRIYAADVYMLRRLTHRVKDNGGPSTHYLCTGFVWDRNGNAPERRSGPFSRCEVHDLDVLQPRSKHSNKPENAPKCALRVPQNEKFPGLSPDPTPKGEGDTRPHTSPHILPSPRCLYSCVFGARLGPQTQILDPPPVAFCY